MDCSINLIGSKKGELERYNKDYPHMEKRVGYILLK